MKAIIVYLIFSSFLTAEPTIQNKPLVKESIFMTMERTPCFGKCPNYKITIFNTGNVIYEGYKFALKEGKYRRKLTEGQLIEITNQLEAIKLFELKDVYDSKITDIPSCMLFFNYNGEKKKILDRDGAPDKLKRFEKFIDALIITDDLKKEEK